MAQKGTRYVGLDVHKDSIAVAVADEDGQLSSLGTIPNVADSIRSLVKKLGAPARLHVLRPERRPHQQAHSNRRPASYWNSWTLWQREGAIEAPSVASGRDRVDA